ncbi:ATP-dependent RNA helicase, putative [Entamoeba invadens IP1]|uniref:ATP-dependent RNA helicase, putative n=1 Tax=Entamoeba invadens IP1 TaxID=370355 RepID=UPI0002C3CE82|nr:ATP-dependent RNA helicase, putative [Entamoeba invadens IP1]ELP94047.1 ATP-dependent RNA helicase, putative [Entamoeba invadens IP1]|eukprot:XP_004260818.1 ATP-dependent RNA helicase, putative [Entamoeba invadens IP1]
MEGLPIQQHVSEIIQCVSTNQITILLGTTGCGKTTMVGQMLYDHSIPHKDPRIVTTNPRRIGAESVSERVSDLRKVELGTFVGYKVRFDDMTSPSTRLFFMTDGILLAELSADPVLSKYDVLIIDEAHERSINTDFLLSYSARLCQKRKDLKIIISSATIDTSELTKYYSGYSLSVGTVTVKGRVFNVNIKYLTGDPSPALNPVVETVLEIHSMYDTGDILIFLSGAEEIEKCCSLIARKATEITAKSDLIILPLYSALQKEKQKKVFLKAPPNTRKIVVATNIAETSITVPGVKFVIDQGLVKTMQSTGGAEGLTLETVSKAGAIQRCGRAGRTEEGICYRLYSEESYNQLRDESVPEIVRVNLEDVVLKLKMLGIGLEETFFVERPPVLNVVEAVRELRYIGAINDDGEITDFGKKLVKFPLSPRQAAAVCEGYTNNVLEEVSELIGMVSQENVFLGSYSGVSGVNNDLIGMIVAYKMWQKYGEVWGTKKGLNPQMMRYSKLIVKQIVEIARDVFNDKSTQETKAMRNRSHSRERDRVKDLEEAIEINHIIKSLKIREIIDAIYSAYFRNTAQRCGKGKYRLKGTNIDTIIHPTSRCNSEKESECVMFITMTVSSSVMLKWVSSINEETVKKHWDDLPKLDLKKLIGEKLYADFTSQKLSGTGSAWSSAKIEVERMQVKRASVEEISDAKQRFLARRAKGHQTPSGK